jgi:hypothetical protein
MHHWQTISTTIVRMRLEIHNVQLNAELVRWEHVTKCIEYYNLPRMRAGIRNVPLYHSDICGSG